MDDVARGCVKEHVLAMPVTQAHNVPHLPSTRRFKDRLGKACPGNPHHLRRYSHETQALWSWRIYIYTYIYALVYAVSPMAPA